MAYENETRRDKINRYIRKKEKRVWKKKISYTCRQNVANKRERVKGRFVRKEKEGEESEETKRKRTGSTFSLESPPK